VHHGGYDPEQHLEDMALDGVAGEVLYPSQGLFYFKVADPALMSAIFRAYNDWLAEFCRTDPARLGLYPCAKGESPYEHCGPRQGYDRDRGAMPCGAYVASPHCCFWFKSGTQRWRQTGKLP
jgi:hypothetical protein